MRDGLLRYVKDISDIVEVVQEQCMYGVRYNRRVLEFLCQQIERAARAVGDLVEPPPEDEVFDHWKALEVALERGKTLIEEHSQPFEFDRFYKVAQVVDLVESICREIEGSLSGLGMARKGVKVKVDSDRIARDKLYMEWYLMCMFDVEDGSLPICEAARDELEVLQSENSARGERMHVIGESAFMWGRSIGHGHGSEVFQARWGAGFQVAVKKFNLSADGKSVEELADFLTEAEISAKWLQHPRIVDCLAASRTGCLVMELARKNLQQLVLEVREISWYMKVQLLTDAAQGLKHLHSQGIVHQAVKSPNFLVFGKTLDNSIVKVADFGFASSRRWSMCSSTGSRGAGSSDPWLAPEDIDGRVPTFASDVFSFGIVMYEVASQSLPYGKFTSDQMPQRKEKWGEPCFGLLKCPEELRELMKQCINPDAKARPSMSTVCSTLEGLLPKVSPRLNGVSRSQKIGSQRSGEFETIDEASSPSSSSSKYDIPTGMDPEKLAAELETLEVDLALEKTVRGVPSYVPGSKTIPPRQEWRHTSAMVPSSASRHSVGSTASVTITLTGTSLVNSHEQPPATPMFEVSSFTENWVSRQRGHKHSHEGRRMSSSTVKSSQYQGSEPSGHARHHHGSSVSDEDTKHLIHETAYEGHIEEAAAQHGDSEKRSSSAVASALHHGPARHNTSSNGSAEEKRMLHNTAFNSVYCTPSSGASTFHVQDDGPTGSYETADAEDNCTAIDELDEALGPCPTPEETTASTIFGVRVPAEISPEQQVSTKYSMQWILNKEVQLRRQSNDRTLLHAAAQGGNLELVAVLAQQYVDIDKIDKYGRTALHDAARWGNADVARLLLDNEANPSFQDIGGETPLHVAACYNHVSVVELLLPEVSEKDMQNNFGNTPLHVAAMSGHLEVLKVLLDGDLDPMIRNKNRKRPQELGDSSVKELFREYLSDRPTLKKWTSQKGLKLFGKS